MSGKLILGSGPVPQAREEAEERQAEEVRKREAIQAAIQARRTQNQDPPSDPMHLMQLRQASAGREAQGPAQPTGVAAVDKQAVAAAPDEKQAAVAPASDGKQAAVAGAAGGAGTAAHGCAAQPGSSTAGAERAAAGDAPAAAHAGAGEARLKEDAPPAALSAAATACEQQAPAAEPAGQPAALPAAGLSAAIAEQQQLQQASQQVASHLAGTRPEQQPGNPALAAAEAAEAEQHSAAASPAASAAQQTEQHRAAASPAAPGAQQAEQQEQRASMAVELLEVPAPLPGPAAPEAASASPAGAASQKASPSPGGTPATPPGLLAAVMGLADTWGSLWAGIGGQGAAQQQEPAANAASTAAEPLHASVGVPAELGDSSGSLTHGEEGWDSPGSSLDELAFTALSHMEAPGTAGLATVAASRPPRELGAEFATPMPQPDWHQAGAAEAASSSVPSGTQS